MILVHYEVKTENRNFSVIYLVSIETSTEEHLLVTNFEAEISFMRKSSVQEAFFFKEQATRKKKRTCFLRTSCRPHGKPSCRGA